MAFSLWLNGRHLTSIEAVASEINVRNKVRFCYLQLREYQKKKGFRLKRFA